jgi:hypothetical protein
MNKALIESFGKQSNYEHSFYKNIEEQINSESNFTPVLNFDFNEEFNEIKSKIIESGSHFNDQRKSSVKKADDDKMTLEKDSSIRKNLLASTSSSDILFSGYFGQKTENFSQNDHAYTFKTNPFPQNFNNEQVSLNKQIPNKSVYFQSSNMNMSQISTTSNHSFADLAKSVSLSSFSSCFNTNQPKKRSKYII